MERLDPRPFGFEGGDEVVLLLVGRLGSGGLLEVGHAALELGDRLGVLEPGVGLRPLEGLALLLEDLLEARAFRDP